MQIGSYLAHEDYIKDHPDIVRSFQLALADLSRWIARHPVATRKFLIAAAKLKRDTALHMALPVWRTEVNAAGLAKTMDLMVKYGVLARPIDVNDLIYRRR
jgi:ABC-type nitrate/sulfonate/bicarbonate transport system substrate-binding protein